jgi:L-fucose isomerase-like protein
MKKIRTIGVLPLARPTFDVAYAEEQLAAMLVVLKATGKTLLGPGRLLMDGETTDAATEALMAQAPDLILILQVTFTDASAAARIAGQFDQPLAIWAIPEPRLGGRLRLNAFCGLNLASHALGLRGRGFSWIYADPRGDDTAGQLDELIAGGRMVKPLRGEKLSADQTAGKAVLKQVAGCKIGRLGDHPDGFDTCDYDRNALKALTDIEVEALPLRKLFDTAGNVSDTAAASVQSEAAEHLTGLDAVDQGELGKSLKLKSAIESIRSQGGFDAFAIRCWPETFTEYGGAVCGPVSMMGEGRVPCACEADVYGAATQLLLQAVADAPVFLVDLVDLDVDDDTGVVWHCGQAPISMADPDSVVEATIHTNRKMPLLYQFPLKPGRFTLLRLSQSFGVHKLVVTTGEVLKRPMAFTGTSGVLRFDQPVAEVLPAVFNSGLEHHMALAYGDHTETLLSLAATLDLPVVRF